MFSLITIWPLSIISPLLQGYSNFTTNKRSINYQKGSLLPSYVVLFIIPKSCCLHLHEKGHLNILKIILNVCLFQLYYITTICRNSCEVTAWKNIFLFLLLRKYFGVWMICCGVVVGKNNFWKKWSRNKCPQNLSISLFLWYSWVMPTSNYGISVSIRRVVTRIQYHCLINELYDLR